ITSEEEEEEKEDGLDERKHQKLLEAISSLGGGRRLRRKRVGERSEAAAQMSEFSVTPAGEAGDQIDLSELIGTVEQTPGVAAHTAKQLKNLQRMKKTVESPLSKQQSQKVQRAAAFQKAATEVSRWSAFITQNRRAEQLVFPLNQEPSGPKPVERQPIDDPALTPADEASVRAMSLEEARARRAELQKNRALQSYYEARARREKRIKSKKFHKVQNKGKKKEFLRRFEDLAKADPGLRWRSSRRWRWLGCRSACPSSTRTAAGGRAPRPSWPSTTRTPARPCRSSWRSTRTDAEGGAERRGGGGGAAAAGGGGGDAAPVCERRGARR
ncbi:unnamed protein product, partial [Tetraodon nigroviridis]